jgi:hypothetical protein
MAVLWLYATHGERISHWRLLNTCQPCYLPTLFQPHPHHHHQVAAAGREAALQYQRFLDTYAPPGAPKPAEFTTAAAGAGGAGLVWEVPEGLEGEDQEAYLRACFSLGRVLHKCSAAEG